MGECGTANYNAKATSFKLRKGKKVSFPLYQPNLTRYRIQLGGVDWDAKVSILEKKSPPRVCSSFRIFRFFAFSLNSCSILQETRIINTDLMRYNK